MSNMPLIPSSPAPVSGGNVGSPAATTAPAIAGAVLASPGTDAAAPAGAAAEPVNFAQALLALRNAGQMAPGTPLVGGKGDTARGGQSLTGAVQAALTVTPTNGGESLPLSGTGLPLALPVVEVGLATEPMSPDLATEITPWSLAEGEQAEMLAGAGVVMPVPLMMQQAPAAAAESFEPSFVAGQGASSLLSEAVLRSRSSVQLMTAQAESPAGRADVLMSPIQATNFSIGPQLASGVVAAVPGQMSSALLDAAALISTDAPMSTVHTPAAAPLVLDTNAARAAPNTWVTTINTPVGSPNWDTAMGEQVKFMAKNELNFAEIRLTPPQLGPVEVRLTMHQDQAQVTLFATHAATRDALEAALPRLRDMFADAGLNLTGANVASESFTEQRGREGPGRDAPQLTHNSGTDVPAEDPVELRTLSLRGGGGLDVFA